LTDHAAETSAAARGLTREDAAALVSCAFLVPAAWLLLGWRPGLLVSGYDAVTALLPMVQRLVDAHGDARALAYRPELLGGVELRDTWGPQPVLVLLAAAGLGATAVVNVCTFAVQALFAFFGQRIVRDLAQLLGRGGWPLGLRTLLAVVFLAFAPFVGWRVGYGHLTLLVGLLPFVVALSLILAAGVGSTTRLLLVVGILGVATSLPFVGQQLVLYGAVFGLPMLAGVWWATGRSPRSLSRPSAALIAGFLLAAPGFVPMLAHASSSDALRELGVSVVTYSYLTAGAMDWLSSLAWGVHPPAYRPPIHVHESNLPVGPLLLLLALWPRRGRAVAVGLGLSAALAVAFASNLRPFSDLLLWTLPPLRSFRVPTRAVLPVLAFLPLVALAAAAFVARDESVAPRRGWPVLAGVAGALVLFAVPPSVREVLGWLLAFALVVHCRRGVARAPGAPSTVVVPILLALAGGSLGAFRERLLPFPDAAALVSDMRALGTRAKESEPALARPLVRVGLETEHRLFGANAGFVAGLASLDGYAFPQRRFVALARALKGEPYAPNALLLRFHEEYPASRVLFQLYNVGFALDGGDTAPRVRERGPTAGAAWFPASIAEDGRLEDLAATLLAWGDATHLEARGTLRTVATDEATRGLLRVLPADCARSEVDATEPASDDTLVLGVGVKAAADCPLVMATNYAEALEAWGHGSGGRARLRTFPAYGALLGVVVPAGTTRVEVRPRPWPPPWTLAVAGLGAGLAAVAMLRRDAR